MLVVSRHPDRPPCCSYCCASLSIPRGASILARSIPTSAPSADAVSLWSCILVLLCNIDVCGKEGRAVALAFTVISSYTGESQSCYYVQVTLVGC